MWRRRRPSSRPLLVLLVSAALCMCASNDAGSEGVAIGAKRNIEGGGGGFAPKIIRISTDTPRPYKEERSLEGWEEGTPNMERQTRRLLKTMASPGSHMHHEMPEERDHTGDGAALDWEAAAAPRARAINEHRSIRSDDAAADGDGSEAGADSALSTKGGGLASRQNHLMPIQTYVGAVSQGDCGAGGGNSGAQSGSQVAGEDAEYDNRGGGGGGGCEGEQRDEGEKSCATVQGVEGGHGGEFVLPFGKHKGEKLKDLPPSYISWLTNCITDRPDLSEALASINGDQIIPMNAGPDVPPVALEQSVRRLDERQGTSGGIAVAGPGAASNNAVRKQPLGSLSSDRWLSRWGLPLPLREAYARAGIKELFEWQVRCLEETGSLSGKSLVYSAPTSGGKTLIAEVLALRQALHKNKKAMIVVPFVSVAAEKAAHLRKLCEGVAIRVSGYYGTVGGAMSQQGAEIAVCTIEKANGMVNRMLEEGRLGELGCLTIDEAHMISDEHRGYLLELLLAKVLASRSSNVQVVCMSATISNIGDLARWTRASQHDTDYRPVPLTNHLVLGREVLSGDGGRSGSGRMLGNRFGTSDPDGVVTLCEEALEKNQSTLVFCASKAACESCAKLVASLLSQPETNATTTDTTTTGFSTPVLPAAQNRSVEGARGLLLDELGRTPAGLDPVLAVTIPQGVAFHHAGLTVDERGLIEAAFSEGTLNILMATSTLAAGVNLPAGRVVIRSPYVGMQKLDAARYRQMCGRAGRSGQCHQGDSFLMVPKPKSWGGGFSVDEARKLITSPLPPLGSVLMGGETGGGGDRLRRAVLEAIVGGLASDKEGVEGYLNSTLHASQGHGVGAGGWAVEWLLGHGFLQVGETGNRSESGHHSTPLNSGTAKDGDVGDGRGLGQKSLFGGEEIRGEARLDQGANIQASPLGKATFASSLSPEQALVVYHDLSEARKGLVLTDELHLLFVLTPVYALTEPPWRRYWSVLCGLPREMASVALAVGVNYTYVEAMACKEAEKKGGRDWQRAGPIDRQHDTHLRFWSALMLRDVVAEMGLPKVCEKYQIARGAVQGLQASSSIFAGMVSTFCARLQWWQFQALCNSFTERLESGAQPDILPLTKVPSVKNFRARALYRAGIVSVEALASSTVSTVANALQGTTPNNLRGHNSGAVERRIAEKIISAAAELLRIQANELQGAVMVSKAVYKAEASENSKLRGRVDDQESLGEDLGGTPLPQHEWQDESEGIL